jgi:hypothetical protein
MSRPFKTNEVPTAPFNLRDEGPLEATALLRRLHGKEPRIANAAAQDTRATVDRDPCPQCGALVEWAYTAKRDTRGKLIRYVYARCRGPARHRWSLQHPGEATTTPQGVAPVPAPKAGPEAVAWIDAQLRALHEKEEELARLREMTLKVLGVTEKKSVG